MGVERDEVSIFITIYNYLFNIFLFLFAIRPFYTIFVGVRVLLLDKLFILANSVVREIFFDFYSITYCNILPFIQFLYFYIHKIFDTLNLFLKQFRLNIFHLQINQKLCKFSLILFNILMIYIMFIHILN